MKFTIDHKTFSKMVREVGRRFPGSVRDKELKLCVVSGIVFATASCRAGGAVGIETEDGECIVPRQPFEDLLQTFKGLRILTVGVKNSTMTIGNFTTPVTGCSSTSTPPRKFEWYGSKPASSPDIAPPKKIEDDEENFAMARATKSPPDPRAKPNSPETPQQHTERMKRWGRENVLASEQGRLLPWRSHPALGSTIVSSTSHPAHKQAESALPPIPAGIEKNIGPPNRIDLQSYFKDVCVFCKGSIEYPVEGVGQHVNCPHCGKLITLVNLDPHRGITRLNPEDQPWNTPFVENTCYFCHGNIGVPAKLAGQRIECPHCGRAHEVYKPSGKASIFIVYVIFGVLVWGLLEGLLYFIGEHPVPLMHFILAICAAAIARFQWERDTRHK